MIILGADPGLQGGLVVLEDGKIKSKTVMPVIQGNKKNDYDINAIIKFVKDNKVTHAGLEKSGTRPLQSAQSTFSTGRGYGLLLGIFSALGLVIILPRPQEWQKKVLAGCPTGETKQQAMLFCERTWPEEDWKATPRCKNLHDGMCDAGGIAWFTYQNFK